APYSRLEETLTIRQASARSRSNDTQCGPSGRSRRAHGPDGRGNIRGRHDRVAAPLGGYEMMERIAEASPRVQARIAGFLYLIVIVGGIFAETFVRGRLVVHGDAAATAHNIMTHELLYRLGFAAEVFYLACNVPLTIIFYGLFKVVNKNVALLEAIFGLVSTAIEGVSLLAHYAPLVLLGRGGYLSAFTTEQLQAAAYLSIQLFEGGFAISLVFFGFDCLTMA